MSLTNASLQNNYEYIIYLNVYYVVIIVKR